MFNYKSNRNTSKLEVSIQKYLSEVDFDRMLYCIEAFIEDTNDMVVFNVLPELDEYIHKELKSHNQQFSKYNIKINIV